MKKYLKLFLIGIFFTFILNVAQAKVPEGISQEKIPENILQAHKTVWQFVLSNKIILKIIRPNISSGTAFFIGPNQVVTNFHVINAFENENYKYHSIKDIYLKQGDKRIKFKRVLYASAVDDLVILETEKTVSDYLNISEEVSLGRLFAFGYPGKVKKILIHLEEYGVTDNTYNYAIAVDKSDLGGLSGGPVLDGQGKIVGVVYRSIQNMLRVIKFSKIVELRRGSIGIDCSGLSFSSCIKKAIENLEEKAEQGDIIAQEELAEMYFEGIGVKKDDKKAFDWIEKAAKQEEGYAPAQYKLAKMYLGGIGVKKDDKKAFDWMEKSAKKDYAPAQYQLARMYFEGIGVKKDDKKAVDWMELSAKQGYAPAQYQLAEMYLYGRGVERNNEQVIDWLSKAAKQGYLEAIDLMLILAEQDDVLAQYQLAEMYLYGRGVKKNIVKAFYWYKKAIKQGKAKDKKFLDNNYRIIFDVKFLELLDGMKFLCRKAFSK